MVKLQYLLPCLVNTLKAETNRNHGVIPEKPVIEIDYQLKPGAFEILTHFIDDTDWIDRFLQHGCWCAKLDPDSSQVALGGPTQVDELDAICKRWAQSRSCSRSSGNACSDYNHQNVFNLMLNYEIEYVYGLEDSVCTDTDACFSETCQIDLFFTQEIVAWKADNEQFVPVSGTVCEIGARSTGFHSSCESWTTTER